MKRVCVIGAGPSGLSIMHWLAKLAPDVDLVCYEKQSQIGGLWNYTWRTGLDEHGEPVHGSMYKHLWSNGPKETVEFADYTFMDHFGKAVPSYLPREAILEYFKARYQISKWEGKIKFQHAVRYVEYDAAADVFHVSVKDLKGNKGLPILKFDYVFVCSSHFSFPNVPDFPGLDTFEGRILHSHDLRNELEYKDQIVVAIGGKYSSEDLAIQLWKYGAKKVVISYRHSPLNYNWPKDVVEERPLPKEISKNTIKFSDGSELNDVDAIILCTGYLHHYPFLEEQLTLKGKTVIYPENLIKGIVWHGAGNNKLLYIGAPYVYYSFSLFDVQAYWAAKYIGGELTIDKKDVEDMKDWFKRGQSLKDFKEEITFQTEYVADLARSSGYPFDMDVKHMWLTLERQKEEDILTYRDKIFTSKHTKIDSTVPSVPFTRNMSGSLSSLLN